MGDMADVDVGDLLDFSPPTIATQSILLYLETIPAARKFMSAARSAAGVKPVIVIKSGRSRDRRKRRPRIPARSPVATPPSMPPSGAPDWCGSKSGGAVRGGGDPNLVEAARRQRADDPDQWRRRRRTRGRRPDPVRWQLAPLTEETVAKLDKVLPANWSRANPIDIIGDATPKRYEATRSMRCSPIEPDAILIINCPTALASSSDAARAVIDAMNRAPNASGYRPS